MYGEHYAECRMKNYLKINNNNEQEDDYARNGDGKN